MAPQYQRMNWTPSMRYDLTGFRGDAFRHNPSADVSGGEAYTLSPEFQQYAAQNGIQQVQWNGPDGVPHYGLMGKDGQIIPGTEARMWDDERGFWNAAQAAMLVTGANMGAAGFGANGLEAGAAGGGEAGAGAFMEANAGSMAPVGNSGGLGAYQAGAGTAGAGTAGAGTAGAGTAGAGAMSYWDMARTGIGLYGMYQNQQALDDARDAANRANDISAEASRRQADLAEASYRNYLEKIQPGLLEDAAFARDRARVTAGQADRLFNEQIDDAGFYRNRWRNTQVPLEDEIIANARRLGTQDEQDRLAGLAMTDVRGNFSDMRAMRERDAQRSGVNLNSGAARALAEEAFMAEALAGASAGTGARFAAMDRYRSGMTDAAALGRGLPGFSSSASGGATGAGGLSIQAGQAGVQAGTSTAGAMTGAQAGISNMWGQSSNSALNGFNAVSSYTNLVRQSPWSTVAGTVFGDWMGKGGKP